MNEKQENKFPSPCPVEEIIKSKKNNEPKLIKINLGLKGILYTHFAPYRTNIPKKWKDLKISVVVSLLQKAHSDLYYKDFPFIELIHFPIKNYDIPKSKEDTLRLVDDLLLKLRRGKNIAIHCYGGSGRTGTITAIIYGRAKKIEGNQAIEQVRKINSAYIETPEQEDFVRRMLSTQDRAY